MMVYRLLGTQPFNPPPLLLPRIPKPIMQPTLSPLPKFHHLRPHPNSTPKLRHRNMLLPLKPLLHLRDLPIQLLPIPQYLALCTRPRPNPRSPDARVEVYLALLARQVTHGAFDADLALLLAPPEGQGGARVGCEVASFARAGSVGVYNEAVGRREFFEIDGAGTDVA